MPDKYNQDEFDYSLFDEENATLFKKAPKKKKKKKVIYEEISTEDSDTFNKIDYIGDYDELDSDLLIDESNKEWDDDEYVEEYDDYDDGEEEEEKNFY